MVQLLNFFFFITFMVVLCGTAAPVLFQWFVSRDVSTGAPFFNGTLIPILISEFLFLVYLHSKKFIRSMDRAKSGVLVRASRPILFKYLIGKSSSARNALFCFVLVLHFLILESMGDLSYLESFCGLSCLQFFCTIFSLPRERSAKRERRRLWSFGNEQRRNDKRRCPNRRVEGPVAFPVRFARARYSLIFSRIFASSSGAGVPPEIGLEALALPTSRLQMAVGHDYYPKVKINLPISHGGVCIFLLGVLLSNTNKIQFTQRLPLGSELHMGKERCCLRGLDHLHGPTFHSICGNFMLSKPDRLHDESDLLPANGKLEFENIRYPHLLYREDEQLLNSLRELSTSCLTFPTGNVSDSLSLSLEHSPQFTQFLNSLNSLRELSTTYLREFSTSCPTHDQRSCKIPTGFWGIEHYVPTGIEHFVRWSLLNSLNSLNSQNPKIPMGFCTTVGRACGILHDRWSCLRELSTTCLRTYFSPGRAKSQNPCGILHDRWSCLRDFGEFSTSCLSGIESLPGEKWVPIGELSTSYQFENMRYPVNTKSLIPGEMNIGISHILKPLRSYLRELSNNLSGIEQLRLLILSLEKMSYNLIFSSMENMSDNLPVVPSGYLIFSNPQHWWMKNNGFEKIFSIENIFSNLSHNNLWFTMFPEKRYFFSLRETTSTTEVAIHTNLFTDLYALIGTGSSRTGGWYTTIMKLPFIFSIWIGFLLASLGGLRSLLRQLQKEKLHWN